MDHPNHQLNVYFTTNAIERCRERIGIALTRDDVDELRQMARDGKWTLIAQTDHDSNSSVYTVVYRGRNINFIVAGEAVVTTQLPGMRYAKDVYIPPFGIGRPERDARRSKLRVIRKSRRYGDPIEED